MPSSTPTRRSVLTVLPVPLLALTLAGLGAGPGPRGVKATASPRPSPAATPAPAVEWKAIDKLIDEQKMEEASRAVSARLAAARAAGNEEEWTRALVREVQLRSALHGYETAVRFLKTEAWPQGELSRATLQLFYAHALLTYQHAYSWEIRQRERVEAKGELDLKAWTADQIAAEAHRALAELWTRREALGQEPVSRLAEYITANNYPERIRGTLRDALSYLFVDLLADSSDWRPEHASEVYRLDRAALVAGAPGTSKAVDLADPAVHPLLKLGALLDDLEAWHLAEGRPEAALEARLQRLQKLHAALSREDDRRLIRDDLRRRLPALREREWWAMGQAVLAEFVRAEERPGALVEARAAAQEAVTAYPQSLGGQRALSLVKAIEAPDYQVAGMQADGAQKRSLQVSHRNLDKLHFRAYALDLVKRVGSARDYNLLPAYQEMRQQLTAAPTVSWTAPLPGTPDFRDHRTFVTPPLTRPGLYVVLASARADFAEDEQNRIVGTNLLVTDLALALRPLAGGGLEVTALAGSSGNPRAGVAVSLYKADWQKGHRVAAQATSAADGTVRFPYGKGTGEGYGYFVLARQGEDVALDPQYLSLQKEGTRTARQAALLYTDRSIYRPQQTVRWKVVAYEGGGEDLRYAVRRSATLQVSLRDANQQVVAEKTVSTNDYGSASGEFVIPPGRLLGQWTLYTPAGGSAAVRVEEYKRPTFEAEFGDPEAVMRLNRPAKLKGTVKYYFGLPVVSGQVRWTVTREAVHPWWWSFWGHGWGRPASPQAPQAIAAGTSSLTEDGTFEVAFTPEADDRESKETSFRYVVSADVTDEGGETRSASRSFRLGFVAVEARLDPATQFFREGEGGAWTLMRTDLDGVGRGGAATWRVTALLQPARTLLPAEQPLPAPPEGKDEGLKTEGDRLRPRWDTSAGEEAILRSWPDGEERGRGSLSHDDKGQAKLTLPALPAGAYRLHYETQDAFGSRYQTSRDFVVAKAEKTPLALPLVLRVERSSLKVGETLRVLAHSGFEGEHLVLDVLRDGRRLERRTLVAGKDGAILEFPIAEAHRGGLAFTLTALRDHQAMTQTETAYVPWDDRELQLSFATFRDRLRPGGHETWRLTVKTPDGKPAEAGAAEVLAYMYDRSLDVFAPHTPPSLSGLYPNRAQAAWVRTTLGQAPGLHLHDSGFGQYPSGPVLMGDRLIFYGGYGIGGLGDRRLLQMAMKSGVVAMAAPPPPPAAPAAQARADVAEEGVPGGVEGGVPGGVVGGVVGGLPMDALERKEAAASAPPVQVRSEFSESAFWQPHLLTGADGTASIEFTVPDSVTAWSVWLHALTKDLRGGSLQQETRSVKELMVRPYVPRFLREGDEAELKVVVNNAADKPLEGAVRLEATEPSTGKDLAAEFGLTSTSRDFRVKPGGGANVTFSLKTPRRVGEVAFKVVAVAGDLSDGELRPLPILPSRVHLAQSRFVALRGADKRTLRFDDLARGGDPSRIDDQLVVTLDGQLFYGLLQALPYLNDYPYECTEQTLNRFVSTGILSSLFKQYPAVGRMAAEMAKRETRLEKWDQPDPNRRMALEESPWVQEARGGADEGPVLKVLDPEVARAQRDSALARLRKTQTSNGAFPWFPGGPPSPFMTLYLMHGFAKLVEFGVEPPRDMTVKAWAYLHQHYVDEIAREMVKDDCCWETITFLNYVLSAYPDASWTGNVFSEAERKQMLDFSFKHWKEHSPYLKAYLALTLSRAARKADARLVFDSVMDSAKTDRDLGTYWAPEDRAWLWYNDRIETHAFALRALMELQPKDTRQDGLVQWLFLNKKLNHWDSTKSTAEVLYSVAKYLENTGGLGTREEATVKLAGRTTTFTFEPDRYTGKRNQITVPGPLDASHAETTVEKTTPGVMFASATWHFSTEKLPDEERGDLFAVSRRFFRREQKGGEKVLVPLAEGAALEPGDEVEVQLSIRAKHAAEYVHLRDPRAAGLEPGVAVSRYRWDLGLVFYEEVRDSGMNFFFEWLPAGEYTLKYRVRANLAGRFRVGPATLQSMYAPEFTAYSTGREIVVGGGGPAAAVTK